MVSPNPMVGAVLVKDGRIIGEGFHAKHGGPHAEPACFDSCTEDPAGATLYVNLEPCCHTKKLTPPCAPLLVFKKVAQVVISNLDPNPAVAGKGVEQLRAAGINVTVGALEAEGERLNEAFFHRMRQGTTYVHVKAAATLDGKSALPDGTSKWITGEEARLDVHRQRLLHDAILVGGETVRQDDPALTVRLPGVKIAKQPYRLILTRSGKLPATSQVFTDEFRHRTLVVTGTDVQVDVLPPQQVIRLPCLDPLPFPEFYAQLAAFGIHSLWVEGGSHIHSLFLAVQQAHRMTLYFAPKIMGEGRPLFTHAAPPLSRLPHLIQTETATLGADWRISGKCTWPT